MYCILFLQTAIGHDQKSIQYNSKLHRYIFQVLFDHHHHHHHHHHHNNNNNNNNNDNNKHKNHKISHLRYMDDLKLIGKSDEELQKRIQTELLVMISIRHLNLTNVQR